MAVTILPSGIRLVDSNGLPTQEFIQFWQQNVQGINEAASAAENSLKGIENLFLAADGDYVSFAGLYKSTPSSVRFEQPIPSLASGEELVTLASDLTKNGFTLYNKKVSTGAPTSHTTGAGIDDGSGNFVAQKPLTDDAYNQVYTFKVSGVIKGTLIGRNPLKWEYNAFYPIDVYYAGAWHEIGAIDFSAIGSSYTYTFTNLEISFIVTQPIGLATDPLPEFRVRKDGFNTITALEVTYETKTTASSTPITDKIKCWVRT